MCVCVYVCEREIMALQYLTVVPYKLKLYPQILQKFIFRTNVVFISKFDYIDGHLRYQNNYM